MSSTTAPLTRSVQGQSTPTGTMTVAFPPVTQGQVWNVAVTVPNAPVTAKLSLLVNGITQYSWVGPSPSIEVEVSRGETISVFATGLAKTANYTAKITGKWWLGTPEGVIPQPNQFNANVTELPAPPSMETGVLTIRRTLKGLGTKVPLCPPTASAFTELIVGILIAGTPTNTGKHIYIGGSLVSVNSFAIPATTGTFSWPWQKAKTWYLLGATGDIANVWAE